MSDLPGSVLFSCTHNSVRSPMAEGLMKHFYGKWVYVDSCGVHTREVDGFSVAVMEEIGIEISHHNPKTFEELEDTSFDIVISLSPQAQHKAVEMTRTMACEVFFWNTFDPSVVEGGRAARLEAYRQVRDQILERIREQFPLASASHV